MVGTVAKVGSNLDSAGLLASAITPYLFIMQAKCRSGAGAPQLSKDTLILVLKHIEPKQRLSTCAFVSKDWRQTANLATSHIKCELGTPERYASLSGWLSRNCSNNQIEALEVDGSMGDCPPSVSVAEAAPRLQLPVCLGKLQVLKLELLECKLQAAGDTTTTTEAVTSSPPAVTASISALTALTRLELDLCWIDLSGLGSCTNLRHLVLDGFALESAAMSVAAGSDSEADDEDNRVGSMLAAALPQLQLLTHLELQGNSPDIRFPASFQGFGVLQQLQELRLQRGCHITSSSSLRFPASLTLLQMLRLPEMTVVAAPTITQLSNLQHLDISSTKHFDPVLLLSFPKLKFLRIRCSLADTVAGEAAATATLLSNLVQLTQLQHLNLQYTLAVKLEAAEPYAALTASSQLTYLNISSTAVPASAAQCIFAAEQPSKGLLEVQVDAAAFAAAGSFKRLALCCPALQTLTVASRSLPRNVEVQVSQRWCAYIKGEAAAMINCLYNRMACLSVDCKR